MTPIEKRKSIWDFYGPDFPQELAGFGRLSPSSKLGLYTDPYHARALDLGVDPSEWEGETRGFMAPITKPQSLWDVTKSELRKDQPIEGLLRDNFTPSTEQLERGDYLVGLSNIAPDPYNLDTWHHEYGHVGQRVATDTPIDSSDTKRSRLTSNVRADDEALQRARDLLYSTSQKEFDKDVEAFTDDWYELGYDISSERFRELLIQVMMEDLGANKKLDEMGVSRGAPPDLTLINKLMKKLGKKPIKPFAPPRWLEWLY